MKKLVFAAAVLMISASAHAGTYSYDGVTVHVQDGCRSSSCVSVYAPGYGYYNGGRSAKVRNVHKDTARVAVAKKDDTAPAAARAPEADVQAAPSDAAPAK